MSSSPSEGHENIPRRWKELKGTDVMRIPPERGCSLLSPTVGGVFRVPSSVFHLPCSVFIALHGSLFTFLSLKISLRAPLREGEDVFFEMTQHKTFVDDVCKTRTGNAA